MGVAPLIRLEGIAKVFRGKGLETHALNGVELEIQRGEYVVVSGPSGCGKSTLLSIIGLLDTPTEGTYALDNEGMTEAGPSRRAALRNRKIGFIFQNFNLIGDLNVFQNVELPLMYAGAAPAERRERVFAALEQVGIADRAKHHPSQLSGGQQQRVAVARALAPKPEIVLADEPTGNLDSRQGESIMDLIKKLHDDGATICLVTHDPRYVGDATRRLELLDGAVVDDSKIG